MNAASQPPAGITFGRFRVLPHRRELLVDGQPVRLGGRAFDVLMALIEMRGAVIDKDALMQRVWPDRVVEENNLQVQISALRAAFGAERDVIRTVAGRGYQFIGEIMVSPSTTDQRPSATVVAAWPKSVLPPTNLPEPSSDLIGRDEELDDIVSLATKHRLVTLTGAGGIGKTRLALEAARRLMPDFADGVVLVELAPLADPGLVPITVATAAGLAIPGAPVSPQIVAEALVRKQLLLVVDNCEHMIGAATMMVEAVLRANAEAHLLITSREPLKTEGEWIYPVPSLAVPKGDVQDEGALLQYGAVRLFLERARAAQPHPMLDPSLTATAAAICRRLDGMPLAIELAAASSAVLGIEEVYARLDNRLQLLTVGRRTALPQHRTLRATLDWSYELLAEPERMVLRCLGIFAGAFDLAAASAVAARDTIAPSQVVASVSNLVAKSLVTRELEDGVTQYRLLETTRAYALEKLIDCGELPGAACRHAGYYREVLQWDRTQSQIQPDNEWLTDRSRHIDNLRAALDWCFSPIGDSSIGVALTVAAVPLWTFMSLLEESCARTEQALAAIRPEGGEDPRLEMELHAALGTALMFARPRVGPELATAWTSALRIAERIDDIEHQRSSLAGLFFSHTAMGEHKVALKVARRMRSLTARRPDPIDPMLGVRAIGYSYHLLGDQRRARRYIERAVSIYGPDMQKPQLNRFLVDQEVLGRVFLARVLWLQGLPEQAMAAARFSIEVAQESNHSLSICYALALAGCPIALLSGELIAAERYVEMLLAASRKYAMTLWQSWGGSFQGVLEIKRGHVEIGLRTLQTSIAEYGEAKPVLRVMAFMGDMAEALGRTARAKDGLAVIGESLAWSERTEARWLSAEFLRVKGELLLMQGEKEAVKTAEEHFQQAIDWGRQQGALSWELRAATSLARLLLDQGCAADAMEVLQPVYERFTEGFETADLKTAKELLAGL